MQIISIHTPKAGGTSMLALWKQTFGNDQVLMDYDDPPVNPCAEFVLDPVGWATRRPRHLPYGIQVVHGHFKPKKYDLLKKAFRMTILRHPVDNIISIYRYWKKIPLQPNAVHEYFLKHNPDIIAFAQFPLLRRLYSETYFGGWDMKKLDFIGRHESRNEDLQRLSRMLGIELDTGLHLNATVPDGVDEEKMALLSDKRRLSQLSDLLKDDIVFYEEHTVLN